MVSPALEIMGMEMPRLAKRAARESGMQLMVHIGDTEKRYDPKVIRPLLPLLEQGDILTHYFTANPGGVLDGNGKLVPEAREAGDRGVWFDTAHGRMNFSFDVGRRVHRPGPDAPLHQHRPHRARPPQHRAQHDRDHDALPRPRLHAAAGGHHVHRRTRPRPSAPRPGSGAWRVGRQADISVLELEDGDWVVYDILGAGLRVNRAVAPHLTVKRGRVFTPDFGPRPWGW